MSQRIDYLLQTAFKIRKGEFRKTFLMFLYAFNAVAAFIIGRIMKDTLFLSGDQYTWLPYMYIIVAIVVSLISIYYTRQVGRFSLQRIVNFTMTIIIAVLLLFRYLLELPNLNFTVAALYVFIEVMGIIIIIQFWTFANELFNAREAKRLFGVIGGGQVLANLYSFPIRGLVDHIGINNLLFVCLASVVACLVIFNYLAKRYRLPSIQRGRNISRQQEDEDITSVRGGVFRGLRNGIIALSVITILAVTFVDYQFKVTARHHYSGKELADYLFLMVAYGGLLACFIQFFITSRLLEKFGIFWALLVLPLVLFSGSIVNLGWIGILGVTLTKGGENVTRYTITETTTQLLYQPLPPALRRRAKAISDGIMRPLAQIVGGLIFIGLNYFLAINMPDRIHELSWATIALIFLWVGVLVSIRQKYLQALLVQGDRKSRLNGTEPEEDERALAVSRAVIEKALASRDEVQIINAIEVIPLSKWSEWDEHVLPLLRSPSAKVREKALHYLGKSGNRKYSRRIQELFTDGEEDVRSSAIQIFCSLEQERAIPVITRFLEESSAQVKAATITGLIRFGGLEGILNSTVELKKMLDSNNASQRKLGAFVLGYIKIQSFYQPLFRLINDENLDVQRAAVLASGEMQSRELVPNLIFKLQNLETRPSAIKALSSFGKSILPQLEDVLMLENVSPLIRQGIPPILGQVHDAHSYELLENLLESRDVKLRTGAIRNMQKLIFRLGDDITPDFDRMQHALHAELESYYQILMLLDTIRLRKNEGKLLIASLEDRAKEILDRAFALLGMIYPREQIDIVSYNLRSDNPIQRANAIEIIDTICESETKKYLLPILDTIAPEEKIAMGMGFFQLERLDIVELLRRILSDDLDNWLVACAIHMIGEGRISELAEELLEFVNHEDPVVRESVLFSYKRLVDTPAFLHVAGMYARERDDVVKGYLDDLYAHVQNA